MSDPTPAGSPRNTSLDGKADEPSFLRALDDALARRNQDEREKRRIQRLLLEKERDDRAVEPPTPEQRAYDDLVDKLAAWDGRGEWPPTKEVFAESLGWNERQITRICYRAEKRQYRRDAIPDAKRRR